MENKVPDGSEHHIIIGTMVLYVFLSRIARQHAFFQDLVLMRWRIYLGSGDARIPRHIMMVKKFKGGLTRDEEGFIRHHYIAAEGFEHISKI